MKRLVVVALVVAVAAVLILHLAVGVKINHAIGYTSAVVCPLGFFVLLLGPILGLPIVERLENRAIRQQHTRAEVEELQHRIAQLGAPHLMAQLGNIYFDQEQYDQASEQYEAALAKEPSLIDAAYKLARCWLHQGRVDEAYGLMEQVFEAKPDHDYGGAYLRLGEAAAAAHKLERAEQVLGMMLRFYPGHLEGTVRLAEVLDAQGRGGEAVPLLDAALFADAHAPKFRRQQNRPWQRKAESLRRSLG